MGVVSARKRNVRIAELTQQLEELEARFQTEMHRRGFDPAQVANMALPTPLARLLEEVGEIKAELEELGIEEQTGGLE